MECVGTVSTAPGTRACLLVFLKEKKKRFQGFARTACSVPAEALLKPLSDLSAAPKVSAGCVGRGKLT